MEKDKMSKADEMFKELSYETYKENENDEFKNITYEKQDGVINGLYDYKFIIFWLEGKEISIYGMHNEIRTINIQELQAINEKVKELGWYE